MGSRLPILGLAAALTLLHSPPLPAQEGGRPTGVVAQRPPTGEPARGEPARGEQEKDQEKREAPPKEAGATNKKAQVPPAKGTTTSRPSPQERVRTLSMADLAWLFERERPIIARYVLTAADLDNDGHLSQAERDWATLEMARRQRIRILKKLRGESDEEDGKSEPKVVEYTSRREKKKRASKVKVPEVQTKTQPATPPK